MHYTLDSMATASGDSRWCLPSLHSPRMRTLSLAPISGRRRQDAERNALWLAPSLVVHALLFAATAINLVEGVRADDRMAHEVIFLAPLLPKNEPTPDPLLQQGPGGAPFGWFALTSTHIDVAGLAIGATTRRTPGLERSVAQRDLAAPPVPDATEPGDEHIYQAVDVDREVVREADASAPVYPESLRLNGVQGGVTVEFVVDTTGRLLDGSMHVIGATHPLFAAAVRDAATGMHFRPAIRGGRIVRQQVIQSFQFVLQTDAQTAAASKNATRPDSVPE